MTPGAVIDIPRSSSLVPRYIYRFFTREAIFSFLAYRFHNERAVGQEYPGREPSGKGRSRVCASNLEKTHDHRAQ